MPGEADYLQVSSEGKLRNAFTALAAMHAALRTGGARECRVGPSPAIAKRRVVWQELVGGGWEAVRNAVAAHGSPDEKETAGEFERHFRTLAPAVEHLLHLSERPSIRLQPTAGDLHAEHVLFVGEQVGGFIDFGAMAVDSVALDVARLVGSMAGDDAVMRRIALDAYRASSSSSGGLSVEEEVLVDVLDRTGILLATYRWLRWVCVERRTFSNRGLVAIRRRALMLRLRKMAETM